jgi:HPt (histidine-containing phosphotransfer) domain-containing protein
LGRRLTDALARGDLLSLREPAHRLKGSLAHLGISNTAKVAGEIERRSSENQDDGRVAGLMDMLLSQVDAFRPAMRPTPAENPHELATV